MNNIDKRAPVIAAALFLLIAVLHMVRIVQQWEVSFNGRLIPVWLSWFFMVVSGGIAWLLLRHAKVDV